MNREDIIRMAREAQSVHATETWTFSLSANQLEHFAALVAAAEREHIGDQCAEQIKAAIEDEREAIIQMMPGGHSVDPQWVCDAIRARTP